MMTDTPPSVKTQSPEVQRFASQKWREMTLVAIDLETTGKYPLQADICEMAACRWQAGAVVAEYQTLVRPRERMSDEVIRIHGITNEMVAEAPPIADVLPEFHAFIGADMIVAHHSPFDMGFLAADFGFHSLPLPPAPALCSSLLSRVTIPESPNHRLQTLIQFLGLPKGQAHRALDDAKACLQVALRSLERLGPEATLQQAFAVQGGALLWSEYTLEPLRQKPHLGRLIEAIREKKPVQLVYMGGSRKGQARSVQPVGLVRNPKGDFVVAFDGLGPTEHVHPKRYFIDKITQVTY